MNDLEFIARISHRVEQRAQGVKYSEQTIFSIRDSALQRLADKIAADGVSYTLLQRTYSLVLSGGEVSLIGLSPTLLLSKDSQKHWYVTLPTQRFSLKKLGSITDKINPPPTPDYSFYIVHQAKLQAFDYAGTNLSGTVSLTGSYVPLLSDPVFDTSAELTDDLLDVAIDLLLMAKKETESN